MSKTEIPIAAVPANLECAICADKLNKSTRIPVACQYCQFVACRTCVQTYILSEPLPKCMNAECGREWTRYFLARHFPKNFMTGKWRAHRGDVLFDQEKAMLPAAQATVELINRLETEKVRYDKLTDEMLRVQREWNLVAGQNVRLRWQIDARLSGREVQQQEERQQFVRHCPADHCRGFLSSQWKCGVCEIYACKECHEVKGDQRDSPHECKPEMVESAKMIMKETRNCPSCATPIFRIFGCDQMWCTICNTAFNWRTGKAQTGGHVHNPHYFEYMNRGGRDAAPVAPANHGCNWEISVASSIVHLHVPNAHRNHKLQQMVLTPANNYIHRIRHLNLVELAGHAPDRMSNEKYRVEYLMNRIDEPTFKARIISNEKTNQKRREYHQLIDMFINVAKDLTERNFNRFRDSSNTLETLEQIMVELNAEVMQVVQYFNAQSQDICDTYNSTAFLKMDNLLNLHSTKREPRNKPRNEPSGEDGTKSRDQTIEEI